MEKKDPKKIEAKKGAVKFMALANYTAPDIVEKPGKKWVAYGNDNDYFGYLLDRYRGSATNHALINGIVEHIYGGGLTSEEKDSKPDLFAAVNEMFSAASIQRWCFDLKCLGFYVMEVYLAADLKSIAKVIHSPVEKWRSGIANDEGVVELQWYSDDWTRSTQPRFRPESFPTYKPGSKEPVQILVVKPYRAGSFYYPYVDYQGCLQYANIEEEISNFHLSNLDNGMFPSLLINFNNGVPEEEKQDEIEAGVYAKWGKTSKAGKIIIAFNDDKDTAATVEVVEMSNLDEMFHLLSGESTEKILVGHRVTSPMLYGIKDNTGLGNNADELKTASILMDATVIRPYRYLIIKSLVYLLMHNGIKIALDFESYNPFADLETSQDPEKPTILSKQDIEMPRGRELTMANELIEKGEDIDEENWELIDSREVDYENEALFDKSLHLASVVSSKPAKTSEQDTSLFKVRYVYAPSSLNKGKTGESREFCKKMVSASKVYRKEDIIASNNQAVNPGWGPHGADTYNIWFYKGGGNCHHFWERRTYLRKNNGKISVNEARRMVVDLPIAERDAARVQVNNPKVAKRPIDMPNKGFLPSNPQGK